MIELLAAAKVLNCCIHTILHTISTIERSLAAFASISLLGGCHNDIVTSVADRPLVFPFVHESFQEAVTSPKLVMPHEQATVHARNRQMRMIRASVASKVALEAEFGVSGIDAGVFSACRATG